MGKKKSAVFRKGSDKNQVVEDGKINAINTWNDVEHDSEDECKQS
jgi:U3 small nucleolar RNA-associated protein 3